MERTENPLPHWPRGEVQKMKVGVFWWTSPAALVKAWRLVKETVRAAINDWHEEILLECHSLGAKKGSPEYLAAAHEDGRPLSPKKAWEMIRLLQRGRSSTQKLVPMKLTKPDGAPASSPAENAAGLKPYLE